MARSIDSAPRAVRGFVPARTDEERFLMRHVEDLARAAEGRGIARYSGFLSDREQDLARAALNRADVPESDHHFEGGWPGAERKLLCLEPEGCYPASPLCCVKLTCRTLSGAALPGHKDYLGSLMGLGITRESVGDILVAEQSVDVLVTEPVRRFLLDSWDSAGRVRLKVQPIGPTELQVPEEKVKLLRDTVSSLRLDSVLSVGFSLSRSKAAEAVTSGKVQVNWADWQKPDRQVVQGDVLTLRGLGKCVLEEVGNQTKKGRVFITVKRYL